MDSTAAHQAASPVIVPGQLTLRTIHGRNGPFTVGRLTTHLGVFEVSRDLPPRHCSLASNWDVALTCLNHGDS